MRPILLGVVVALGCFAFQPDAARANHDTPAPNLAVGTDWALLTIPITRDSNTMYLRFDAYGQADGTGPAVIGSGRTDGFFGPSVNLWSLGNGPFDVTTSQGAASHRVQVAPGRASTFSTGSSSSCSGRCNVAGTVVHRLVFVANGTLSNVTFMAVDDIGVVPGTLITGSGSGVVTAGKTTNGGIGAAALGNATGATSHTASPAAAIVGGFAYSCGVAACESTWEAPDGRSGSNLRVNGGAVGLGFGDGVFAGPAGRWDWSWTGLLGRDVYGAYAPIGDAWTAFNTID